MPNYLNPINVMDKAIEKAWESKAVRYGTFVFLFTETMHRITEGRRKKQDAAHRIGEAVRSHLHLPHHAQPHEQAQEIATEAMPQIGPTEPQLSEVSND
jgi:hypothetical protein